MDTLPAPFVVKDDVQRALKQNRPVVALESTVLTHGLPHPTNLALGRDMEAAVLADGATPATIGVLHGTVRVGLTDAELAELAQAAAAMKVSRRDFAAAVVKKASGGTTVAGTMFAADKVGIRVFATGGIGGVHREARFDVSPDLQALASTRMIVVCAGAKSILDLPSTLEMLETNGVPALGYGTDEFPAFFSRRSGFKTSARVDSPQEAADFARAHWELGMPSAVLVCRPISAEDEIPREEIDPVEEQASREAQERGIGGQALTPFLLQRVNELTDGKSMRANLSLLLGNARLAAQIAKAMIPPLKTRDL
ncbi:MAG: pseudouridine-5'-phosphate glycosidase [Anaerolineales bacterium]|jgi:pseudouridine-5'-phosphate glycosidase|nr:Pseudouridine-5'-phosphate glycosidase [Anaerolineales bacterium]MBW7920069.1 pseudouridine-5'-phosphate glycosidase [Anaerolineales bacterium]MCZ7548720.1 pseudouridine-5'-phosphate glycosidase [Anaerolineales bacterium]MDX9936377.1 pseudouridine-5'-phosphate glycosidase [Anaerolineales bacterium]GER80980.1 pseudouridine-5-phosphate glycosidase [Candidatus Denitrolinea symbiosum]